VSANLAGRNVAMDQGKQHLGKQKQTKSSQFRSTPWQKKQEQMVVSGAPKLRFPWQMVCSTGFPDIP